MNAVRPEVRLGRMLEALESELIEATDEEIVAAAKDLGMDPGMKGSAAFIGLKYPILPGLRGVVRGASVAWESESEQDATATRIDPKGRSPRTRR